MSWAARRRLVILIIIGAIVIAFLAVVLIAALYKTPSCTDGIHNQDEAGIDCGGSCNYLCVADVQPPTVLFTKALQNSSGRVDVVAVIENKNKNAAAKNVPYRITLYGSDQTIIQEANGIIDLPPSTRVPVYIPGITSVGREIANVFLDIAASAPQWFSVSGDSRIVPIVLNTKIGGTPDAPRIEAVLANSSATTLSNIPVIVLVLNAKKDVIAASKTIVPAISVQGQATALFTWNEAFDEEIVSIEAMPVIPLPDR